jgi:signal transduction histidine kinase
MALIQIQQQTDPCEMERELAYYRRECNELGARLLRLQEEQSQSFREARRSRTVAKLIREAYRLVGSDIPDDAIGEPMLEIIVNNAMCDRAAFLQEIEPGSGCFSIVQSVGCEKEHVPTRVTVIPTPAFFFTTARSNLEAPAFVLTDILRLPYILWAFDRGTGYALIIGNHSESNVSRPFEPGDQEFVEGALHVYLDVLMRKSAETKLRQAKAVAEEASNMRTRFMATLSHELRTPLNSIIGYSELMLKKDRANAGSRDTGEYAGQILEAGNNLLSLINNILDYSSLVNSAPRLKKQWVCVGALLHSTMRGFVATIAEKRLAMTIDQPDPGLEIFVDYVRFRQIITNLLSNAVKFTLPGGTIHLSAERQEEAGLVITVRDTGIGMNAQDASKAVEPFVQLENSLRRGYQGTGLGLSIAKDLSEAHGGALAISSELQKGTSVMVTLPVSCVRLADSAVCEGG